MTASRESLATAHNDGLPQAGFDALAEVFSRHLAAIEGGMSFCVYREGRPLARFHGGSTVRPGGSPAEGAAEPGPWTQETMAVLFSGTKGVVATVAAILIDRGLLDPAASVASYWPEFAAAGKERVTVAQVLSHTVGLAYVDQAPEDRYDNHAQAAALAAQETLWEPGTKVAYHALTYGYLTAELFFRVTGKGPGQLFRELVAEPLSLELHLGLPAALDGRLATVFRSSDYAISTFLQDPERRKIVERMYGNSLTGPGDPVNSVDMRRAELAAGGCIATADAMAALYSHLASPTPALVSPATLRTSTATWSEGVDAINDRPLRFGLGYELADPLGSYGPVTPAFGHSGAGGGLHGAWPGKNVGFSFLTNEMQPEDRDRRAKDLLAALARTV
ncbi:serine hydrolase domain-containing protein [Paeniglutamicibacter cryotolerans]|uniref:CubicO group peptidase (Beta-lactamase class C family) n=1 Tax=Paeniglutamicibacter cryotolerans TaxID=670079 RepID=A0A839QUQ4_9MICC|nr:serine hydrolase domain-containing protein [Paeniglutamicibacter cryotolerans]MBB2997022.1 CubicO group peptidase (beta-lactamase class C family) [Paeniglutamicibacter cryotolerans]